MWVRGSLVNTGTKDISPSMTERPISLGLPAGSNWLSASVVTASQSVKASVRISEPGIITFDSGLLRRNEFIRFQGVAELAIPLPALSAAGSLEEALKNSMRFNHRIEDTDPVESFDLWPEKGISKRFLAYLGMVTAGVIFLITLAVSTPRLGFFNTLACDLRIENNKSTRVIVREMLTDSVRVRALEGSFSARMTTAEFFSKCSGNPTVVRDRSRTVAAFAATSLVYVLLPSVLICFRLRDYLTNRKLRRLLGLEKVKSVSAPGESLAL
jgi:hypothetical protein